MTQCYTQLFDYYDSAIPSYLTMSGHSAIPSHMTLLRHSAICLYEDTVSSVSPTRER